MAQLIDALIVVDCVLARSAVHVVGRLRHVWCVWVFRIAAIVVVAYVDAVVVVAAVELDLPFALAAYAVYAVTTVDARVAVAGPEVVVARPPVDGIVRTSYGPVTVVLALDVVVTTATVQRIVPLNI